MKISLFFFLLVISVYGRNYPLYKQCDSKWGSEQLGTSSNTICSAGCLMSSASMALKGTGHDFNPSTLNKWLNSHGGYVSGDLFVWASINSLGLTFEGKVANSQIKSKLDQGKIVICNVHGGHHWVLAYGYNGDNILVNDPGYSTTSYALTQIVDGQNGIYHANSKIGSFGKALSNLRRKITSNENIQETIADGGLLEEEILIS